MNQLGFQISQPDNLEPITHIGLWLGPKKGENDMLFHIRVLPTEKQGDKVFGRTLRIGEKIQAKGLLWRMVKHWSFHQRV